MRHSRPDILSRPIFFLALGLLLLNDFYLKYEFSNFLTGKLSDIAGLFLFPYFFSSLRIKWAKSIYVGTAISFIFWKSHYSQEIIDLARTSGIGINRVIDYTDLFALLILPLSYGYFQKQLLTEHRIRQYLTMPIKIFSLFSILATTLPNEKVDVNLDVKEVYEIQMSKIDFFNSIQPRLRHIDTLEKNLADSIFYLHFDITDGSRADVTVLSTITAIDSTRTKIILDKILYGYITGGLFSGVDSDDVKHFSSISAEEFKGHFKNNFIKPIEDRKAECLYYDNKEIYDSYQNE